VKTRQKDAAERTDVRDVRRTISATIGPAAPSDAPAIAALLAAAELPAADFAPHLANFLIARVEGRLVGAVGAEIYGADALLRSVVIAPEARARGLATRLLEELDRTAARRGVRRWWLLTTTAQDFFARRGFRATPRSEVPATVAATGEFRDLCPATAVCMSRAVASDIP
jgi:amino-acid N-acetyltransferase